MATPCSNVAWGIPWTEEPGGLQPMGSQRVGHGWATNTQMYFVLSSLYLFPSIPLSVFTSLSVPLPLSLSIFPSVDGHLSTSVYPFICLSISPSPPSIHPSCTWTVKGTLSSFDFLCRKLNEAIHFSLKGSCPWFTCHEFTHFLLRKMVWQEPWGSYSALCLCAWEPLSARHFKLLTQRSWGVGVNPSELSTQSPVS